MAFLSELELRHVTSAHAQTFRHDFFFATLYLYQNNEQKASIDEEEK